MTEELWEKKQWMKVVFLNDHQSKTKVAVVCDLPGVPVPSEAQWHWTVQMGFSTGSWILGLRLHYG